MHLCIKQNVIMDELIFFYLITFSSTVLNTEILKAKLPNCSSLQKYILAERTKLEQSDIIYHMLSY